MHKIAIIQARMSSSRLPGKVLKDIAGRPMLQHVIERSMRARLVDGIVVATTLDPSDDELAEFCHRQGIPCFRGSLPDVLDRYYQAARQYHADVIIRLTADCPLIDPDVLDLTVKAFLGAELSQPLAGPLTEQHAFEFAADRFPPPWKRTIPIGLDVEVCSFAALDKAWHQADQPYHREHVMPFLYEGVVFPQSNSAKQPEWYVESDQTPRGSRVALLNHAPNLGDLRWTVDTPADLEFVRQVYAHFGAYQVFGWQDVLALLQAEPELAKINAGVAHKTAFDVDQRTAEH
jgi:spore coat polysaccharide biosynthesis protein SpsF